MIQTYLQLCRNLFLDPAILFREQFKKFSLSEALCFGLVSTWLSSLLVFFFKSISNVALHAVFQNWIEEFLDTAEILPSNIQVVKDFLWQGGSLLLHPFLTLWNIFFLAGVVYFFGKLFIQEQLNFSFKNCVKILAFASGGMWLNIVPVFGPLIGYIVFTILLIIGLREVFLISTKRATLIVMSPQVILVTFLALMLGTLLLFASVWTELIFSGGVSEF